MGFPPSFSKVVTVGPSLSGEIEFVADFAGQNIGLIAPDNTPMYDFDVFNGNGTLVASAKDISLQHALLECRFQLSGLCRVVISGAADQGDYTVEFFPK